MTSRRWLSVRVVLVAGAAIIVAGLASWLISWWFAPLDAVHMNRLAPSVFTARGIVAIGYAGFAFALGIATSTLTRRTVPAMAATLLTFIAARSAITLWVRPHLLHAKEVLVSVTYGQGVGFVSSASGVSVAPNATPIPNAWILSTALVDRARHALRAAQLHDLLNRACPAIVAGLPQRTGSPAKRPRGPASGPILTCEQRLSHQVQQLVTYKPLLAAASARGRDLLAAAVALIAVAIWRVGPRVARKPAASRPRNDSLPRSPRRSRQRSPNAPSAPPQTTTGARTAMLAPPPRMATASHLTGPRARDGDFVCSVWH